MTENSLLHFNEDKIKHKKKQEVVRKTTSLPPIVKATDNPYDAVTSPLDILDYLPPDNSKFALYADPYGRMMYYEPKIGNSQGRYWLQETLESHSITQEEMKLLQFLSTNRIATRNQIQRVLFDSTVSVDKVKRFLQKCRKRGIICSFSWISPLKDGRKKPLVYGLTRVGVEAVYHLYREELEREFTFQPIIFPEGKAPDMTNFYLDLAANELYSELKRLDRVIEWERKKRTYRFPNGRFYKPFVSFEVIKDEGEFHKFWLEVVRVFPGWESAVAGRFRLIQEAFEQLAPAERPSRVVLIVDSVSRVECLCDAANDIMPDVPIRFTTDELLLEGINQNTFLRRKDDGSLVRSPIPFLSESHTGMNASEYFASLSESFQDEVEDLFED
ncbi:hypothetical protein BpOF4_20939 (plasmid) [Alkalihalophilus pseudofirmus OF4]|uniref:Uncharacterized protein n=1 Tax=Alkalihalophilus pseudofirmus (strain ATCC BAA-2126 / JCM 17055 / OF4) TaxID=398511 RepID=D3G1F7_ALKPO|nr:replication-relaxation family protein [Alkalihalophilus pseudofirmus]ADC52183.1 hypothetical protein BpOF4_20939 [Alkalihalophilus pseudofirmus OF4]